MRFSERSYRTLTPLDIEAGSVVWSIGRLRGYLWRTSSRIFLDHRALESRNLKVRGMQRGKQKVAMQVGGAEIPAERLQGRFFQNHADAQGSQTTKAPPCIRGLSYYRKFLSELAKRIRPITISGSSGVSRCRVEALSSWCKTYATGTRRSG